MPVSIGIGATKTLAKCADRYAKDYPGYNKCCLIDTDEKTYQRRFRLFPIKEVWGIGYRYRARLESININSAYDFTMKPRAWIKRNLRLLASALGWNCKASIASRPKICRRRKAFVPAAVFLGQSAIFPLKIPMFPMMQRDVPRSCGISTASVPWLLSSSKQAVFARICLNMAIMARLCFSPLPMPHRKS